MKAKISILISILLLSITVSSCLTPGDRVNMEEFKRQLEAGGQSVEEEREAETGEAVEAAAQAEGAHNEAEPGVTGGKSDKTEIFAIAPAKAAVEAVPEKPKTGGNAFGWIFVFVFAALFAVFALVAFIISRRKKEDEQGEIAAEKPHVQTEPAREAPVTEAAEEIKADPAAENAAAETEKTPEAGLPEEREKAGKYRPRESFDEEKEAAAEALNAPAPAMPQQVVPPAKEAVFGEGKAAVSATQFAAGSGGNTVSLSYRVGPDSPEFRIIRITVPKGWSVPSMIASEPGYFTASTNSGSITSVSCEGMTMTVAVAGLAANTGEVLILYGNKTGGGPGAKAQDAAGQAVFKIETESKGGKELLEIESSPVV
ncbi:MAG TPA: hypothetical protein P5511_07345, partial [Candidatus Goldiibacteriota bacterium]|nr:hypothetical protein [Candidatus Goldiibacteriota bacterium]